MAPTQEVPTFTVTLTPTIAETTQPPTLPPYPRSSTRWLMAPLLSVSVLAWMVRRSFCCGPHAEPTAAELEEEDRSVELLPVVTIDDYLDDDDDPAESDVTPTSFAESYIRMEP